MRKPCKPRNSLVALWGAPRSTQNPPRSQDASACGCGMTKGTRCTPFRQTTRAPSACGCSPRGVRAGSPPKLVRIPHQDTDHLLSLPRGAFFGLYRGKYPGNSFEIVNSAFSLPRGAFFTFVSYHSICAQCTERRLGPAPRRPPRSRNRTAALEFPRPNQVFKPVSCPLVTVYALTKSTANGFARL